MVYNKIPVVFGASNFAVASLANYQYDTVQFLVIEGLELPEYYEVDFCNVDDEQTITMVGTASGVQIPDNFLLDGRDIKAYIVIAEDGSVETRYEVTIPVVKRPERSDIEPTPTEQLLIDDLITALSDGVTRAGSAAESAGSYATIAANQSEEAEGYALASANAKDSALEAQRKAEEANESAENYAESIRESANQIWQNADDIAEIRQSMSTGGLAFYEQGSGNVVIAKINE